MSVRRAVGRGLWLAIWLGWAYFGYWLYVNLPRTFVLVNRLTFERPTTCLGFVRDSRLMACRIEPEPTDGRPIPGPIRTLDVRSGARVSEFVFEDADAVSVSPATGLVAASVPISGAGPKSYYALELANLLTEERWRVPDFKELGGRIRPTFHRTLPWIGLYWKDPGPAGARHIAVYDAVAKRFVFESIRADENDPSAYFTTRPMFVDNGRRFGVMLRSARHLGVRVDIWEIPSDGKAHRLKSTGWSTRLESAVGVVNRITSNEFLVSDSAEGFSGGHELWEERPSFPSDDGRIDHLLPTTVDGRLIVDVKNGKFFEGENTPQWVWPTKEAMVWHDGLRSCWMFDEGLNDSLVKANRWLWSHSIKRQLPTDVIVVRDLPTGRFCSRVYSPIPFTHWSGLGWRMAESGISSAGSAGAYLVCRDSEVYSTETRPMWSLIAAAQAITALPLVGAWLFRRWRRSRLLRTGAPID